jgi:hypothetical protein
VQKLIERDIPIGNYYVFSWKLDAEYIWRIKFDTKDDMCTFGELALSSSKFLLDESIRATPIDFEVSKIWLWGCYLEDGIKLLMRSCPLQRFLQRSICQVSCSLDSFSPNGVW